MIYHFLVKKDRNGKTFKIVVFWTFFSLAENRKTIDF